MDLTPGKLRVHTLWTSCGWIKMKTHKDPQKRWYIHQPLRIIGPSKKEGFESVWRRALGSPNHQFWDRMILRARTNWPFFCGLDRHHFIGQIFQNMGHLGSRQYEPAVKNGWCGNWRNTSTSSFIFLLQTHQKKHTQDLGYLGWANGTQLLNESSCAIGTSNEIHQCIERPWHISTQMLHGNGIFAYISPKFKVNVGKYSIHAMLVYTP